MMKLFAMSALVGLHFFGSHALTADIYETQCKKGDCFRYGWITTGKVSGSDAYTLDTDCIGSDCAKFGWGSIANDGSTYEVACKAGGCFVEGWASRQTLTVPVAGVHLDDEVTCRSSDCLKSGWNVSTGNDLMGGSVKCHHSNCAVYGGYSVWRGRNSHTTCYQGDCYHKGWTLFID